MKSLLKLLLCAALAASVLCLPGIAAASARPLPDQGFVITDYDVTAVVSESNAYDVTETIQVAFSEARHGIFREIPVNGELTRAVAGKQVTTRVGSSVSNVKVPGHKFSVSRTQEMVTIKIGDPKVFVQGPQTYVISYRLRFGNDGVQACDEAYFNIIGADWPVSIGRVTFRVTLPKPFDAKKLGFSMGSRGSTGYDPDRLRFTVDGNTVSGLVPEGLSSYQSLTMRAELPQGYFLVADLRLPDWIVMGIAGLTALFSVMAFLLFGVDRRVVKTVEFNPPEGFTPLETGYAYDGRADDRDVTALLLFWAHRGYLTIEKAEGCFTLNKRREMGKEAKEYERYMFGKLFKNRTSVTTKELNNSFYKTVESVKLMVETSFQPDDRRIYTKESMKLKPWIGFLTIVPVIATLMLALWRVYIGPGFAITMSVMMGVGVSLPVFLLIHTMRRWRTDTKLAHRVKLSFSLVLYAGATAAFVATAVGNAHEPLMPWFAALCTAAIALSAVFIQKRTPQGALWLGRIMGLKDFILLVEKDKLEALLEQDPGCFYGVLPYAWALNVTDKWVEKFAGLAIEPPDWYHGGIDSFSTKAFAGSLSGAMSSIESHMTSAPASSGGGGSSGGSGFSSGSSSGGGGGGGGGGSW